MGPRNLALAADSENIGHGLQNCGWRNGGRASRLAASHEVQWACCAERGQPMPLIPLVAPVLYSVGAGRGKIYLATIVGLVPASRVPPVASLVRGAAQFAQGGPYHPT
eukprot:COSAG05_NODE_12279_length_474_cov_1.434667_1_plen_107_part_10